MARATRSVTKRARHKRWIKRAKGYRGRRSRVFKLAKEAVLKAGQHAYHDRRKKKGQFRKLWHVHINAAARQHGLSYSQLMHGLKEQKIELNRKMLAEIAELHPDLFADIAKSIEQKDETKKA